MERRVVLAVVLAIGVLFLTPRLFPPAARQTPVAPTATDSARQPPVAAQTAPDSLRPAPQRVEAVSAPDSQLARVDTTITRAGSATVTFQSRGATLEQVELGDFRSLSGTTGPVRLDSRWDPLLAYSLVTPNDTVDLSRVAFAVDANATTRETTYRARVADLNVVLRYAVDTGGYIIRVNGEVSDSAGRPAGDNVVLLVNLPRALESFEANIVEDRRGMSVAFKPTPRGASQIALRSLDPNERRIESGPIDWVALKSKYFILGVLARDSASAFAELQVTGLAQPERDFPVARTVLLQRVRNGAFGFDVYAGPQKWDAMLAVGREFQGANSYGGWLQPIVQPFATIVMRVLLWMHRALSLHYGWVLLLFGVLVRVAMWPLNQTAMKSSMRMQELQPLLADVQKRHKSDPQRMSAETMRLYKEHGMSPFSPLAGCFPILLSMPVLFALFFVFQGTIEFRGVPFLWLPDISLKDPIYVAPLLMGASMFFTSWLSMRSMPPNPQTKIMTYFLPVMMTVLLANMASGLNLYWAAQNVASIPQQWLISRERARRKAKQA